MIRTFKSNEAGSSTVEFVTIFPFFMFAVLLVVEVTLALYWWKAAEKAAYLGARAAIVSSPVVTGLPTTNPLTGANNTYGMSCGDAGTPCTAFATLTCDGKTMTGCDATAFDRVLTTVQKVFFAAKASNLTITYQYIGLGFAGGPVVPLVTVKLSGIPFQTGFVSIVGNILGQKGQGLATMPDITSTLTGEDLNASGG